MSCIQRRHCVLYSEERLCLVFRGEIVSCVQKRHCALLRAKTSALLRRKTCAVLRARTCALLKANTKEAAFGRLHKGGRPSAAPLCGFLCIGSEQSTCPRSQHSTCLASQQGRCLGSQQGTVSPLNTRHKLSSEQSLLILARSCFLEK